MSDPNEPHDTEPCAYCEAYDPVDHVITIPPPPRVPDDAERLLALADDALAETWA